MLSKIPAIIIFIGFYGVYLAKMVLQRLRGIHTDQMGKGGKDKKLATQELVMKLATYSTALVQFVSIMLAYDIMSDVNAVIIRKMFGIYIGIVADIIFFMAVYTMRDSWRAGISPDEKTKMVTEGIYRYSRNPAFLGFDLMYISLVLIYFNPLIIVFSIFAIVMLHLQILSEEKFLPSVFGQEYLDYKEKAHRYFGRGKWNWDKLRAFAYLIIIIWSVLYYITIILYAGPFLSFSWVWLLLALYSAIRLYVLNGSIRAKEDGKAFWLKLPIWISIIYQILFAIAVAGFVYIEASVVTAMNQNETEGLDYIIVLGASVSDRGASAPLSLRIRKAYEYARNNEGTIIIASGGRGSNERYAEADIIMGALLRMGMDGDRIIVENQSTSTYENLHNSFDLIPDGAQVGVVTSGFHMYRTMLIAQDMGEQIVPIPSENLYPVGIHYIVREFFGVVQFVMNW